MADEVAHLAVEILKQIRDEVRSSNERLARLEETVRGSNERLSHLEATVEAGFTRTTERLESLERAVVRMGKVNDAVLEEQLKDSQRLEGIEIRLRRLQDHAGLPPLR